MKIRVNNLISDIGIADLQKMFAEYGKVASVSLTSDRDAPFGSRHIAFIDMPMRDEGLSAIKALNNTTVKNLTITVAEASGKE